MTRLVAHQHAHRTVIKLCFPKFDASLVAEFKRQFAELVQPDAGPLVLDMSEVRFVDSSALGALVGVHKLCAASGRVAIVGATPTVLGLLRLTRMDRVFDLYDTLDAATAGVVV
jgi:anti-sigma B factor antagonist